MLVMFESSQLLSLFARRNIKNGNEKTPITQNANANSIVAIIYQLTGLTVGGVAIGGHGRRGVQKIRRGNGSSSGFGTFSGKSSTDLGSAKPPLEE